MSVSKDVREHADDLKERLKDISTFEALQIATKIVETVSYTATNALVAGSLNNVASTVERLEGGKVKNSYEHVAQ